MTKYSKLYEKKTYALTPCAIDEISDEIFSFCNSADCDRKISLGFRLNAEQALIKWMENGDEGAEIGLIMYRKFGSQRIDLVETGSELDPFADDDGAFGSYGSKFLATLNLSPYYSFQKGENRLSFKLPKKEKSQLGMLAVVILLSLIVGMAGKFLLPADFTRSLCVSLINPVYDLFFTILGCIAGPMIFLSVAWGIYGIGDSRTFGRVGKRMMLSYVGASFLACAFACLLEPVIGPSFGASDSGSAQIESIVELITGMVPATIIEPFANGNTLQIIVMSVIVGMAMLFLEDRTGVVADLIEQINFIIQFLMGFISKLVPYVVFLVIVSLIWSDELSGLGRIWILFVVMIAAFIAAAVVFTLVTSIRQKISPVILVRKNMPTFLIALATASSAASFATNVSACEKKFGIRKNITSFGVPLGMVMHKPISAIYNFSLILFFASQYDIVISPIWLFVMVTVCSLVSIATPPIPGGGAAAYAILFTQAGIPSEAIGVVLAIDVITDFFITAFEVYCLPLSLLNIASGLGMVNYDTLRSDCGE